MAHAAVCQGGRRHDTPPPHVLPLRPGPGWSRRPPSRGKEGSGCRRHFGEPACVSGGPFEGRVAFPCPPLPSLCRRRGAGPGLRERWRGGALRRRRGAEARGLHPSAGRGVPLAAAVAAGGGGRWRRFPPHTHTDALPGPTSSPRLCATCRLPQADARLFLPARPPAGSAARTGVSISSRPDPRSRRILPGYRRFRPLWPGFAHGGFADGCVELVCVV